MRAVLKRKEFYWAEKIYTKLVVTLLPYIGKTFITPNMVTLLNIINIFTISWCILNEQYIITAILVQVYLFFDILDGNLARYKHMCSKTGKIFDRVSDSIFYYGFFSLLGLKLGVGLIWVILYLIVHITYAITATKYIVPNIRRLKVFERRGIKKYFIDRGIIYGMDLSTQDVITTVFLLTPYKQWIFYLITIIFAVDLFYRLHELYYNIKLNQESNITC